MNINLIYRIENIIKRINADSFDQELISSLIICVREQLPVNGMAREIGDFIAHPRLKDRGHVYKNIKKVHESLLKSYDKEANQLNGRITIENPIDINESLTELENTLLIIDKNLCILRNDKRASELQACMLLLLQGSRIKINDLDGVESVELRLAVNPSGYLCLRAVLPMPLRDPQQTNPTYLAEIKYELITSSVKFIPLKVDALGWGEFNGILNARRDEGGKILYSLISQQVN
ncbi:MAG: hypothetical protein P4L65_02980 [Legionella sp.]|nr:hypothetical protein [Legionella sp.]